MGTFGAPPSPFFVELGHGHDKTRTCNFDLQSNKHQPHLDWLVLLQCWETYVGQQFYKLAVLDFFVIIGVTFLVQYPRKYVSIKNRGFFYKSLSNYEVRGSSQF